MFSYSTLLRPLFWIGMGLLYALIAASAKLWVQDLNLSMTWWKWTLAALWYALLSFSFAGAFTLIGENERQAGYRFLVFHLGLTLIAGVGLCYLIRPLSHL
jgi:hypothetical protein